MNWFYWNTAWSLFFSLIWFMTITHNPDAQIADAHLRDEAFRGSTTAAWPVLLRLDGIRRTLSPPSLRLPSISTGRAPMHPGYLGHDLDPWHS